MAISMITKKQKLDVTAITLNTEISKGHISDVTMATDIVSGKTTPSFIQTQIDFHNKNSKSVSDKYYLDLAIADFVHSNGLAFRIVEDKKFKNLLHYAHTTSTSYEPPKRKQVSESFLDVIYNNYVTEKKSSQS